MNEILRFPDEASRVGALAGIISEVDRKLKQMEDQRAVLLYLRGLALKEAARATTSMGLRDKTKMLHHMMKEQRNSIADMSSLLGLRQQVVDDILAQIEREFSQRQ
jgi:hypothetical protein